ncbi:uncharacterized protein LOC101463157 [Ceratitis capitata]|uniref:uncharacterized protein LOC101463157 n=1 Tax=Ceratitis capitata TaxID=7213 RepID=UPI000329CDF0|nr:uncharacterized protein LOC101463157 [Ceratitis capitata]
MSSQHCRPPTATSAHVSDTQNNVTVTETEARNFVDVDEIALVKTPAPEIKQGKQKTAEADTTQSVTRRGRVEICDQPQASDQHKVKDNNNSHRKEQVSELTNAIAATENVSSLGVKLKTSIYDWDSPSSFTGTVKRRNRRPHTVAGASLNVPRGVGYVKVQQNAASENSSLSVKALASQPTAVDTTDRRKTTETNQINICDNKRNNNAISASQANETSSKLKRHTVRNEESASYKKKTANLLRTMPKSQRQSKEKSKLRHSKSLAAADRNANNPTSTATPPESPGSEHNPLTTSLHSHKSAPGTIPKSSKGSASLNSSQTHINRNLCNASYTHTNELVNDSHALRDANYMELSFYNGRYTGADSTQFAELFCDFPASYGSTTVITNSQFAKCGLQHSPQPPPPYREPPPPTPPPISQMPTRDSRYLAMQTSTEGSASVSAPATPSRGKVVLSKKERKELSKLNARLGVYDGSENAGGSASATSSPYKGRVSELKNCLARGLFASLSRGSQKSLTANSAPQEDVTTSSIEVSPPPPAPPDTSPPNSNASNNNDADYSEKLKNLPVRQRKTHVSHMDNYCLFDPVDFINEKAMRQRAHEQLGRMFEPAATHGLRDPLFSSRQNLNFSEEEIVPEVIYNEELPGEEDSTLMIEVTYGEACGGAASNASNFDHHNYFVIDPDDFEEEPIGDIGIPNPFTNEQLVHANLEALAVECVARVDEPILHESASLEQLLEVLDAAPSMSNSQESKDTNTTTSRTTTTSTALVESSTSTNSTSSSTSATSSQTTLQRTKKRLTFLNLSPFRSLSSKNSTAAGNTGGTNTEKRGKRQQRAISELVSSEHMLHLQNMLLDGKANLRARTVPIESNYVLFNPGPVPSRNVPYKIRKPRPLSSCSDADSGFLSPCSPDELSSSKLGSAILVLQQCDSIQCHIEVSKF